MSFMSDNKDTLREHLQTLKLGADEAKVYLELLREPSTHLKLSRTTGISRSKIYRIAAQLEKRSLITKGSDDQGTFLIAADPSTLEVELVAQEEQLKHQRIVLSALIPSLAQLQSTDQRNFMVRTYEGEEGLKQMCWHELKAEDEVLAMGHGTIESFIPSKRWAEKHRQRTVDAGYQIRDLINDTDKRSDAFTANSAFMQQYACRSIPGHLLPLTSQVAIYNNTVAIYSNRDNQRVGVEIVNAEFATTLRTIFNHYWQLGTNIL